jgi:hypothetical protein
MKRLILLVFAIGMFALAICSPVPTYADDPGVRIGVLVCEAIPGSGYNLLITSKVDIKCTFQDPEGNKEYYVGETGIGLGVDLGFKSRSRIAFTVISMTSDYKIGSYALAGKYVGGKASAALGVGGGVAVLVGGGAKNFSLQPLALEGCEGVNVAAGLGYRYLEPDPRYKR